MKLMKSGATALAVAVITVSALSSVQAARQYSIEDFIKGFPEAAPNLCKEMSADHGAERLWVGRFEGRSGDRHSGRKGAYRTVCFTKRKTCLRWLGAMNRDFSGWQRIAQCSRGYSG